MDRTIIRDLRVRGIVGIHERERHTPQEILINIVIENDMRAAARSDDIGEALDYSAVVEEVAEYVLASRHFLIETLATGIAEICLRSERATKAVVRVEKPEAIEAAEAVGVEIEREREELD